MEGGIALEPSPTQYSALKKNRNCLTVNKAISTKSGKASFFDITSGFTQNSGLKETFYNKTYESVLYNGDIAIGTVNLLIDDEIIMSWEYNIGAKESKIFNFEWTALAGYHEFEVIASVSDGETILENNNMTKTATFKAEVKSSFLPYPNFITVSVLLVGISVLKHRKAN